LRPRTPRERWPEGWPNSETPQTAMRGELQRIQTGQSAPSDSAPTSPRRPTTCPSP
jgi:hypothetical protein